MDPTGLLDARLTTPGELIAALPYLLGFHPLDSLVVATIQPGAPPTVGLVLRADLPPAGHEREFAEQLCAPLRARNIALAVLVVIGGPPQPPPAVAVLRTALAGLKITVVHALRAESTAAGAVWTCLDDPQRCGRLPDPAASPLAALSVAAGEVTFADREQLHGLVAPHDDDALRRRGHLLDLAVAATTGHHDESTVVNGVRLVRTAAAAAARGQLPSTDEEIVRLAVALSEPLVRDSCLDLCLGPSARAAEQLWLALTRATPAPEVAEPATLAALSAYLRGDGALAGMALERALQAWPGHSLSTVLDGVLQHAVPPPVLARLLTDAIDDAALQRAEDHGRPRKVPFLRHPDPGMDHGSAAAS